MAHTKGTEPKKKRGGKPADETPGAEPDRGSETRGVNEQDPKRRIGRFGGAGEHELKQPGRRQ
jgi:hypothetical protein